MTTVPTESLSTLVAVRNMSRKRSTARMRPTASRGSPTALRMMDIMTRPAIGTLAAPMDARSAVSTMRSCEVKVSSKP